MLVSDPPNTCFRERLFDFWLVRIASSVSLVTLMCWRRLTPIWCLEWHEVQVHPWYA